MDVKWDEDREVWIHTEHHFSHRRRNAVIPASSMVEVVVTIVTYVARHCHEIQ